jgi:hypothetical protein
MDAATARDVFEDRTDAAGEPFEARPVSGRCDLYGTALGTRGCTGVGVRQLDPVRQEFGDSDRWIYACDACIDEHWQSV